MLPKTPAGKLDLVLQLLQPELEWDEDGNCIKYGDPLITPEEARELLGFEDEKQDKQ